MLARSHSLLNYGLGTANMSCAVKLGYNFHFHSVFHVYIHCLVCSADSAVGLVVCSTKYLVPLCTGHENAYICSYAYINELDWHFTRCINIIISRGFVRYYRYMVVNVIFIVPWLYCLWVQVGYCWLLKRLGFRCIDFNFELWPTHLCAIWKSGIRKRFCTCNK